MPSATDSFSERRSEDWLARLAALPDDALARLLDARIDLRMPVPASREELARRAISAPSVWSYFEHLDHSSRALIEAVCVLEPVSAQQLSEALGTPEEPLCRLVSDLAGAAMLELGESGVSANPALHSLLRYPAGVGPALSRLLEASSLGALKDMARRLAIKPPSSKRALIEAISGLLSDPQVVLATVAAGPPGCAELAERLRKRPVLAVYGGIYNTSRSDATPEGWFLRRGLLVSQSWESAVVPREVTLALRGGKLHPDFSLDPPDFSLDSPAALAERCPQPRGSGGDHPARTEDARSPLPDEKWRGEADRIGARVSLGLVADIATLIAEWEDDAPKTLKSGGIGVREVRRACKLLGRSETETARVVEIAAAAALVAVDDRRGVVLPTALYDSWSALDPADQWARLAIAWVECTLHLGLAGLLGANEKPIPPLSARGYEPRAISRRRLVLEILLQLPPGAKISTEGLVARAIWQMPALWAGGPATPQTLVRCLLEEAALLGLVAEGTTVSAARAVASGSAEGAAEALRGFCPPLVSEIVLQGDLTAVAAGTLAPPLRAELDLIAEVESAGAATVYRFSEASIRRGLDAGRSCEDIARLLERHAPKGIPQALSYMLADLGRRFGQLRVGKATSYLRSDDPALVAEVVRARKTARLKLRSLAPTVALSPKPTSEVIETLRAAGYLPAAEDSTGAIQLRAPVRERAVPPAPGYGSMLGIYLDRHPGIAAWSASYSAVGGPTLEALRRATRQGGVLPEPEDTASVIRQLPKDATGAQASSLPASSGIAGSQADLGHIFGTEAFFQEAFAEGFYGGAFGDEGFGDEAFDEEGFDEEEVGDALDELELLSALEELAFQRPSEIARGAEAVMEMARMAALMEWAVRLSCALERSFQVSGFVSDTSPGGVTLEPLGGEDAIELPLSNIEWIRVLTEAEEAAAL